MRGEMNKTTQFKQGDTVKLIISRYGCGRSDPVRGEYRSKISGKITTINPSDTEAFKVRWSNGVSNSYLATDLARIDIEWNEEENDC